MIHTDDTYVILYVCQHLSIIVWTHGIYLAWLYTTTSKAIVTVTASVTPLARAQHQNRSPARSCPTTIFHKAMCIYLEMALCSAYAVQWTLAHHP